MPATPKGKKMRAFRVALAIASALMFSRVVQGQSCDVPPNGVLVNDQYLPDPAGRYWLFDNWRDDSGDGRLRFGQGDYFNFRDHLNQPVRMSDPGVLSATYNGETWYYVSGSSSTFDYANVAIYRTRDFRTFDLHMLAFDESNQNGSGQSRTGNVLTADGRTYFQVWGPNFWIDQGANDLEPVVHMVFVAIENYIPTPADYPQGFHSIYQASIPLSAFQSWHSLAEPLTNDGPRFNDPRLPHQIRWWFGYLDPLSGNLKYDGGLSAGIPIATTVSRVHEGPNCGQVGLRVWGKYHHCVGGVQGMTAMFIDPFVFVDEAQPENGTWRRTLFYSWHDHDPAIPYDQYGEYLAAVPLSPGSYRVRNNTSVVPLAYSRNSNNQLFGLRHDGVIGFFDNGAGDIAGRETLFTAVAEGPCAFSRALKKCGVAARRIGRPDARAA